MFSILDRESVVSQFVENHNSYKSWILWKPVQSGKTADSLDLAGMFYKSSLIIFIGDKNTGLQAQTDSRAKVKGFEVVNYADKINLQKYFLTSLGKKKVLSFLMEINNLETLSRVLSIIDDVPVTLVIDEADKSRNTSLAGTKKGKNNSDEDEEELVDSDQMPPVTKYLLKLKNLVKVRENSRAIFVTATPMGVLAAEKDRWAVMYKEPYQNYVGVGLNHPPAIHISQNVIRENACPAKSRWTGNYEDVSFNSFYPVLDTACRAFDSLTTKDSSIKQLMLISLETLKRSQFAMASRCKDILSEIGNTSIDVLVLNGDTKEESLASMIKKSKNSKIIVVAGFMASRGVSYTDFSDKENQFELVCQVHYTKPTDKLNTAMQAMRIFGPARRTVSRPSIITNRLGIEDLQHNFMESYRIIRDIAEQCEQDKIAVVSGAYNTQRKLTQEYNFRFLKQGWVGSRFIHESSSLEDHLPID